MTAPSEQPAPSSPSALGSPPPLSSPSLTWKIVAFGCSVGNFGVILRSCPEHIQEPSRVEPAVFYHWVLISRTSQKSHLEKAMLQKVWRNCLRPHVTSCRHWTSGKGKTRDQAFSSRHSGLLKGRLAFSSAWALLENW